MKKMVFTLSLFVLFSLITPVICANSINKTIKDNLNPSEEPVSFGSIYGNAGTLHIWGFSPVRFAIITAGGKTTMSGPFMGEYKITGLPLGTHTITGRKIGYNTFTCLVTLTENYPDKQVFIDLQPNDKSINVKLNQIKPILHTTTCFFILSILNYKIN